MHTNTESLIAQIKSGNKSLYQAREEAKAAGQYNDDVETALKSAHEATMQDVCKHQSKMARVMRRGY